MTTTIDENTEVLARSTYIRNSGEWNRVTVGEVVEGWNWNANIFEIYDEIRDWDRRDQENVLRYAYDYFNKDKMVNELASHLTGSGFDD